MRGNCQSVGIYIICIEVVLLYFPAMSFKTGSHDLEGTRKECNQRVEQKLIGVCTLMGKSRHIFWS